MDWMKPVERADIPEGDEWIYEVKYDGFRCELRISANKNITLMSKNNHDISKKFPEIINWCLDHYDYFKGKVPLKFDGELVILNHRYQANFALIQARGRMQRVDRIEKLANQRQANLMIFDITEIKGEKLRQNKLSTRKEILHELLEPISDKSVLKYVEVFTSIAEIKKVVSESKSEGIIAKRKDSSYQKGKNNDWFKIKNWRVIQGVLTAYNPSNGYFAVNVLDNDKLINIGSCKHGLPRDTAETLHKLFKDQGKLVKGSYHLPPAITSTINTLDLYDSELREPNFKSINPNTSYTECTLDKLQLDMAQLPIEVSNTDKFLWPNTFTKKDLLVYIREISPWMLPFLKQRALTIIRGPDGIDEESFFQKSLPDYAPDDLSFESHADLIVCNHLRALVWLANHASIEYHVPFQKVGHATPLEIVFDLDPPDREHFVLAVKAAKLVKQILDDLDLVSFVKTSGNKGIQVYIPIREGSMTYDETSIFTEAVAKTLERAYPNYFTTERLKKNRHGRLYIDYVQHGKDKTLIASYSPRMTKEGTVSTPLYWREVNEDLTPTAFTIGNVVERVRERGCPFLRYFETGRRQRLDKVLKMVKD